MKVFKHLNANNIKLIPKPFQRELLLEAFLIQNEELLKIDGIDTEDQPEVIAFEQALRGGRKGRDGRIDLVIKYDNDTLGIAELKNGLITEEALHQLDEYINPANRSQLLHEISQKASKRGESIDFNEDIKIIGILIGNKIDSSLIQAIQNGSLGEHCTDSNTEYAAIEINRYEALGELEGTIFTTTESYYRPTGKRDLTKYSLNDSGIPLGKGRLVQEVIRLLATSNTYAELKDLFPDQLQGRYGVFTSEQFALQIKQESPSHRARHFISPDDILETKDKIKICVCSQWGMGNIEPFISSTNQNIKSIQIKPIS